MFIESRPSNQELSGFEVTPERWQKAVEHYKIHKLDMVKAAVFSKRNAVSHRNPPFKVGSSAMGIEPNQPDGEYAVYQGYNFTPTPGARKGAEKRCAERNVLDVAKNRAKVVVALLTVSKEIHTGDATKSHGVLHPCKECRMMLRNLLQQGLLREDSIMCHANDSSPKIVFEETTLKELLQRYSDDEQ